MWEEVVNTPDLGHVFGFKTKNTYSPPFIPLNCHILCLLFLMRSPQVAHTLAGFYTPQGIYEGLKSLYFFGSVEWNIAGITSCAFPSAGLIGVLELIPPVSLPA